jgi:hypothetical protein
LRGCFCWVGDTPASEGVALQLDPLGVVKEAVEDGVGISGMTDHLMPFIDGELAGDDCGATAVAFLENFEEIMTGFGSERLKAPVVDSR